MRSSALAEGNRWAIRPIRLAFRLGPVMLSRRRMNFAVLDAHFTTLGADPDAVRPPFEEWGPDVVGALAVGHPVPPGAPLPRVTIRPDAIRYVPARFVNYYTSLTGTFEEYLAKFSAKTRSTLKRKVRKLAERSGGTIDWRVYRTPEEIDEFYPLARRVAEKTYQERLLDAALPASPEFRAEVRHLAALGKARAYLLFMDHQPIAYLYCPIRDRAVLYEHLGYDPGHKELSPGTVLQYLALEQLFAEGGYSVFDFTEGEGQHKAMFSTGSIECAHVYFFRRTAANLCLVGVHAGLGALTRSAGALLDRLEVRERVRRYLRGRSSEG